MTSAAVATPNTDARYEGEKAINTSPSGGPAAKGSSFYGRREVMTLEMQIYNELNEGLAHVHTVNKTDYYMSGKDHLNQKTINQYSLIKRLGEGEFGVVWLAHVNETHEDFALKIFSKGKLQGRKDMYKDENTGKLIKKNWLDECYKEIKIMEKLENENCVRLHEVIDMEGHDKLIMALDYCAKGEIMSWDEESRAFAPCFDDVDTFSEVEI